MDAEMERSPSLFDPENLSSRDDYRRYRKRQSSPNMSAFLGSSNYKSADMDSLYDGSNSSIRGLPNAALLLEEIKQEVESHDIDNIKFFEYKAPDSSRRRISSDRHGLPGLSFGSEPTSPLKAFKHGDEIPADTGESSFLLFSSLLDSALQGLIPFADLILHFEKTCRNISESIRFGGIGRHRILEDKLMRQDAQLLLDEAASWSLLWHLFGKGTEDLPENFILNPSTSHQEVCQFVMSDITAQLCLRIVLWLEGLSSEALDLEKKIKGCHVGTYLPSSGIWHHTQRYLKRHNGDSSIVKHLDFDAPTREAAQEIYDDRKQDESLLEDIWTLLRAGRREEACELCRSAGQPWRAGTLCPFGGFDLCPSIEALQKNGKNRMLQAFELESGIGRQLFLWKWASFCASEKVAERDGGKYEIAVFASQCSNVKRMLPVCTDWESACWALAKSWLDVQVDIVLEQFKQNSSESDKNYRSDLQQGVGTSQASDGPERWPSQIINQQPRDISSLLQKLHSIDVVHESVSRACKEQHRQIEMNLMQGDICHLLDLLWSWVSPSEDHQNVLRPHGDPQVIRFSAHLVLIFRYLVADDLKDNLREKLFTVGDLIIHMYAMFLFSKQHEELVGIYAAQLARHRCIEFFVQIMELRLNDSYQEKYKIFRSAMEYLPFSTADNEKACFEDIIESVLSRSRETKVSQYGDAHSDVAEQHRMQSLQKAKAVQWLCFTAPPTLCQIKLITARLLMKALIHSNMLFREFALISIWRIPKMPIGAHMLLGFLAEPLKQPTDTLLSLEDRNVHENVQEFENWREYYACDATYRNWLKIELEKTDVADLSLEEKDRAIAVAKETLDSSLKLLLRKGNSWLCTTEDSPYNPNDRIFIELHATAMLCLPSGECLHPDATLCTTFSSALYSSVSEEDVQNRQLAVNVAVSPEDKFCVGVSMRCIAVEGDGLGLNQGDGGILAKILASGFKGELNHFQSGVTMEISKLDSWYSADDGSLECPATYIVRGLCRTCCLPEMVLRCMQVSVSLCESGETTDFRCQLIDLVTDPQIGLLNLFSQQQLQEFLFFERECSLYRMELLEESSLYET